MYGLNPPLGDILIDPSLVKAVVVNCMETLLTIGGGSLIIRLVCGYPIVS